MEIEKLLNKVWRTPSGEKVSPTVWLTQEFANISADKYERPVIHVGTDSQRSRKGRFAFVFVIAIDFSKGGRYIYLSQVFKRKDYDKRARLSDEVVATMHIAEKLRNLFPTWPLEVDFDLNSDTAWFSSELVEWAKGWASGMGFVANVKPNGQIATKAADSHVRSI